jgi:hypothetical protein
MKAMNAFLFPNINRILDTKHHHLQTQYILLPALEHLPVVIINNALIASQ